MNKLQNKNKLNSFSLGLKLFYKTAQTSCIKAIVTLQRDYVSQELKVQTQVLKESYFSFSYSIALYPKIFKYKD
jgi:hypothetical protein